MLGKRADGTLAWWALVSLAPYFLFTWLTWSLQRILLRENVADAVAPGVWVGRRPLARELPEGVRTVVDLTAEFPAARGLHQRIRYLSGPVLDGTAPDPRVLRGLLGQLQHEEGILFHCASGHGRSATAAAAMVIARGGAADVEHAEADLRRRRPGIRMNSAQRELLREMFARPGDRRGYRAQGPRARPR
jgi:protein-tyrosine phosphatase